MQLNSEQKDKLFTWINTHWGYSAACPMCRHSQWGVSDSIFEFREFFQGNMVVGGRITPVVPVTCAHCGNTIFLNAIQLGIVQGLPGGQNK